MARNPQRCPPQPGSTGGPRNASKRRGSGSVRLYPQYQDRKVAIAGGIKPPGSDPRLSEPRLLSQARTRLTRPSGAGRAAASSRKTGSLGRSVPGSLDVGAPDGAESWLRG